MAFLFCSLEIGCKDWVHIGLATDLDSIWRLQFIGDVVFSIAGWATTDAGMFVFNQIPSACINCVASNALHFNVNYTYSKRSALIQFAARSTTKMLAKMLFAKFKNWPEFIRVSVCKEWPTFGIEWGRGSERTRYAQGWTTKNKRNHN